MRFAAVGHLTNDVLASGLAPGGSALYAALAARALGHQAHLVTSFGPDFVGSALLQGLTVDCTPAVRTTCFENVYEDGRRRQRVLAVATPLRTPVTGADIVFACPVAGEVLPAVLVRPRAAGLLGAGLQGWLRAIAPDGTVSARDLLDVGMLSQCDAVFASEEDLPPGSDLLDRLRARVPLLVMTTGARGADVYLAGTPYHVPAHPARQVDPTGAGDVFATAFLLALGQDLPPLECAVVAACAASVVVEGPGTAALAALTPAVVAARVASLRAAMNAPPPGAV